MEDARVCLRTQQAEESKATLDTWGLGVASTSICVSDSPFAMEDKCQDRDTLSSSPSCQMICPTASGERKALGAWFQAIGTDASTNMESQVLQTGMSFLSPFIFVPTL